MEVQRTTFKIYAAKVVGAAVNFGGIVVFSRYLGPDVFGSLVLFQLLGTVITIGSAFGYNQALTKRVSEGGNRERLLSTTLVVHTVILVFVVGCLLLFRSLLNAYIGAQLTAYLVAFVVLEQGGFFSLALLRGDLEVEQTALPSLVKHVLFAVIGGGLVVGGYGLIGAVVGLLVGSGGRFVVGLARCNLSLGPVGRETFRSLTTFAKHAFVTKIGQYGFRWTDVFLIGLLVSNAAAGIYEIPWRIVGIVLLLSGSLSRVSFPQVSAWESDQQWDNIANLLSGAVLSTFFLTIPACAGILVLAPDILTFLFGSEYSRGALVLVVVMAQTVVASVEQILGDALQALKQQRLKARIDMFALLLNAGLNIGLVLQFGILGAAVATSLATVLRTGIEIRYVSTKVPLSFRWQHLFSICIASTFMTGFLLVVEHFFDVSNTVHLIAVVTAGFLVYSSFVLLLPNTRSFLQRNVRAAVPLP